MAALHISAGRQMETTMIVSHNKYKQLPCPLCLGGFAGGQWDISERFCQVQSPLRGGG